MTLTWRTVDLQRSDFSLWLEISEGLDELPEYRGSDSTIPGLAGQRPRDRIADRLPIVLTGWIRGVGATPQDKLDSYRAIWDELQAMMLPYLAAGPLDHTLEDGTTVVSANARGVNILPGRRATAARWVNVELEAVDPPYWTGGTTPWVP